MDLFQCVLAPREDFDNEYRQTRSVDRDIVKTREERETYRGQSLPNYGRPRRSSSHQTVPTYPRRLPTTTNMSLNRSRSRNPSSSRSNGSHNGGGMRHWGSSLSLESDVSVFDLTKRTLRPPSPTTMSRATTPLGWRATPPPEILTKPKTVPMTARSNMRHPELADYLVKPRLVNTLGCDGVRPWSVEDDDTPYHARRLSHNERPPYRNLRLGGFMEGRNRSPELIPEMLRQYYYDTYLDSCGNAGGTSSGLLLKTNTVQRGM